ncbi:MAG: TPM domain-containing protein [Methylocystis sp.]
MRITKEDYRRVAEAIQAAEQKTGVEIVCVLARRSSDYSYVPALWASFVALATPWPLILFTHLPVREIFATQIAVFIAAALLFQLTPLHSLLTPRRIKRARAHRAALEQFFTRGVGRTSDRRGVLIFASLAERYARIIADVGVAEKIKDEEWRAALDPLREDLRAGRVADGYIAAIAETTRLLDGRFPPGGKDELPDKLFVM